VFGRGSCRFAFLGEGGREGRRRRVVLLGLAVGSVSACVPLCGVRLLFCCAVSAHGPSPWAPPRVSSLGDGNVHDSTNESGKAAPALPLLFGFWDPGSGVPVVTPGRGIHSGHLILT
jgi:hypothetical protein